VSPGEEWKDSREGGEERGREKKRGEEERKGGRREGEKERKEKIKEREIMETMPFTIATKNNDYK
jgi:hypothetical protein